MPFSNSHNLPSLSSTRNAIPTVRVAILKPRLETSHKPSTLHYLIFRADLNQAGKTRVSSLRENSILEEFFLLAKLPSFKHYQRGRAISFEIIKIFLKFQNTIMPRS